MFISKLREEVEVSHPLGDGRGVYLYVIDGDADVGGFRFRAVRPTFDLHPFQVNGEPQSDGTVRLWSQDHEGWLTMDAVATLR